MSEVWSIGGSSKYCFWVDFGSNHAKLCRIAGIAICKVYWKANAIEMELVSV